MQGVFFCAKSRRINVLISLIFLNLNVIIFNRRKHNKHPINFMKGSEWNGQQNRHLNLSN